MMATSATNLFFSAPQISRIRRQRERNAKSNLVFTYKIFLFHLIFILAFALVLFGRRSESRYQELIYPGAYFQNLSKDSVFIFKRDILVPVRNQVVS